MFIISIVFAIILGYILGGRIRNLEKLNIKGIYIIFISFGLEFAIVMCIRKGILYIGLTSYLLDVIMYLLLLIFVILNRKNISIIIMGLGFLLNAIPIFLNGGTMPVSRSAIKIAGLDPNISAEGLYRVIDSSTKLWFLGDIIPINFINNFIISIGDIFTAIGLILLIVTGMKKNKFN